MQIKHSPFCQLHVHLPPALAVANSITIYFATIALIFVIAEWYCRHVSRCQLRFSLCYSHVCQQDSYSDVMLAISKINCLPSTNQCCLLFAFAEYDCEIYASSSAK